MSIKHILVGDASPAPSLPCVLGQLFNFSESQKHRLKIGMAIRAVHA